MTCQGQGWILIIFCSELSPHGSLMDVKIWSQAVWSQTGFKFAWRLFHLVRSQALLREYRQVSALVSMKAPR